MECYLFNMKHMLVQWKTVAYALNILKSKNHIALIAKPCMSYPSLGAGITYDLAMFQVCWFFLAWIFNPDWLWPSSMGREWEGSNFFWIFKEIIVFIKLSLLTSVCTVSSIQSWNRRSTAESLVSVFFCNLFVKTNGLTPITYWKGSSTGNQSPKEWCGL